MTLSNLVAGQCDRVLPRPRNRRHRRPGFSLVELLVVVVIVSLLLTLLLPAVQGVRESANRLQCANHLKQIGVAWQMHHDAHKFLPSGGWGWDWIGDPDRGFGPQQPGAWAFNILPYVEETVVRDLGSGMSDSDKSTANVQRVATPVPLFYCPSRRAATLYPNLEQPLAVNCGAVALVARLDYAANVGNPNTTTNPAGVDPADCGALSYCQCNAGPPSLAAADSGDWSSWANTTAFNGVSYSRSTVSFRQITDGLSQTAMVGEKNMDPTQYETGTFNADNESLYSGFDNDLYKTTGFGPQQDSPTNADLYRFGSAHADAFNMVFCDGSVRQIIYEIDDSVFGALGSRSGGEIVAVSEADL